MRIRFVSFLSTVPEQRSLGLRSRTIGSNRPGRELATHARWKKFVMLGLFGSVLLIFAQQATAPAPGPEHGLPLTGIQAEEFLRSAEIIELRQFDTRGVTKPRRAVLTDGTRRLRAVFKDIDESAMKKTLADGEVILMFRDSYRHEIAAYELDKLLALEMVPPCVRRRVGSDVGALCLWVEGAMTEWQRQVEHDLEPPDLEEWNEQMHTLRLFLQLTYDLDYKNISNVLVDPDFKIYKIDSSRAFRTDTELRKPASLTRFSRSVLEALRKLDRNDVESHLGAWLTDEQIDALMVRRDLILELAAARVAEQGEEGVLFR